MKKTLISLFLLLALVQISFAQGIGSAKDLVAFINACNNAQSTDQWMAADSCFHFTADIDLSKEKKFPQLSSFCGVLKGDGHKLMGWKTSAALVDELQKNSEISGIIIDATCDLKATCKGDECFIAFLVNRNHGKVYGCENHGSINVKGNYTSQSLYVGTLVASNRYIVMDCTNAGDLRCSISGVEQKVELEGMVGGVVGGNSDKPEAGFSVIRCVNSGSIYFTSDYPVMSVGGVIGNAFKGSVKYCVNKAPVRTTSFKSDAEKPASAQERVGGVCGFTKGDISCCDNFGEVLTEGKAAAYVGGIIGQPHAALCVTDCVNYGTVTAKNENQNFVGGIAGNVGRPAHFRRCFNRGTVTFDGICMDKRSCAGGIVGQVYCPKTSTEGTYIRECANYGEIIAHNGGNRASNGDDAIHAGGITGYMTARDGFRAFLSECSNFGKVTADGGRRGNICPVRPSNTKTGGSLTNEDAIGLEPLEDGTNVYGRVSDKQGIGISGIVVTDGRQCVKTDDNGNYRMTSDLKEAHFIYFSAPAGSKLASRQGIPAFFKRIPRGAKAVQADFTLEMGTPSDKYTVMMIGDPQVRPFGTDDSMERWWDTVAPDAEKFRASNPGETYCINLGDLVYNYMYAYDDYLDGSAQIQCPVYNVIGNHDYDQQTLFESSLGYMYYENYVSPEHYSFDLGKIHYIVLNTILYDRQKTTEGYANGLDDRTMEWLENDLSFVDKDRVLVCCSHAQLFKKKGTSPNGSHGAYNRNYDKYRSLLGQYKAVYSWSGHYHNNFQYNYAGADTKWGAPNIQAISVTRCTGALRLNKYLGSSGEPQGYVVMNVDGESLDWYYKGVGLGKESQMTIYSPIRTQDGTVKVNIWNWAEQWSKPVWYENGKAAGEMEFHPEIDLDYQAVFDQVTNKTTRKYCKPTEDANIFRITPSAGVTSGEVKVKDQFGNEYMTSISW